MNPLDSIPKKPWDKVDDNEERKYSDDQERDEFGRFSGSGGGVDLPGVAERGGGGGGGTRVARAAAAAPARIRNVDRLLGSREEQISWLVTRGGEVVANVGYHSNDVSAAQLDNARCRGLYGATEDGYSVLITYDLSFARGGSWEESTLKYHDEILDTLEGQGLASSKDPPAIMYVSDDAGMSAYKYEPDEDKGRKSIDPAHLELKARWAKKVDATATKWEGEATAAARAALEADMREVLALLGGAKGKAKQAKASIDWEEFKLDVSNYMQGGANGNWRSEFRKVLEGVITDQGNSMVAEFGLRFDVPNIGAEDWFDEYTMTFAQPINATTESVISEVIQQGIKEGWSIDTMQGHLQEVFQQWMSGDVPPEDFEWYAARVPNYRAEMIARTETIRASNAGTMELASSWGVVERKEWLATGDDRTRDAHMEAWETYSEGGSIGPIPMDEPFIVDGEEMMFPGDASMGASPGNFINCRCTWIPWFGENAGEATIDRQGTAALHAGGQVKYSEDQERDELGRFGSGGGSAGVGEAAQSALGREEARMMALKDERVIVVNPATGGEVYRSEPGAGGRMRGSIPSDVLKQAAGMVMLHNHPDSNSFSPKDVELAIKYEVAETRVIGADGSTYRMVFDSAVRGDEALAVEAAGTTYDKETGTYATAWAAFADAHEGITYSEGKH